MSYRFIQSFIFFTDGSIKPAIAISIILVGFFSACTKPLLSGGEVLPDQSQLNIKASASKVFKPHIDECGSCHIAYPAGYLPQRSWTKLMTGLEDHFGENAGLDDEPRLQILTYLRGHAADSKFSSARSKKFLRSISSTDSPLRITETPYWKQKHSPIKQYVWKRASIGSKSKCDSCHKEADKGIFDDRSVKIPKSQGWF